MATFVSNLGTGVAGGVYDREENPQNPEVPELNGSDCPDFGRLAMLEKTQDFFLVCDIENKGFVRRKDMQRLNGELPLTAEELENVFDTLDADGNGSLTLEEFSTGFSEFLYGRRISVVEVPDEPVPTPTPEKFYQSQCEEKLAADVEDDERHFSLLMESLGASNVFEEPDEVRSLWTHLRRDEPHLLANFEEFLARVTCQINEARKEKREMENALKRKVTTHDDEIQRLYEEMEQQIKNEKERIVLQDSERFLSHSHHMEQQLSSKERELEQLFQKQKRLEHQCQDLHSEHRVTSVENMKLKQTNEELARELERTNQQLALAQDQLGLLQEQSSYLHQNREMEMYRITEGLQREKTSLLKQLDLLREMNKHLRDDRDMCYLKPKTSVTRPSQKQTSGTAEEQTEAKQGLKSEDEVDLYLRRRSSLGLNGLGPNLGQEVDAECASMGRRPLRRIISIEEDHLPQLLLLQERSTQLPQWSEEDREEEAADTQTRNTTSLDCPLPLPNHHLDSPLSDQEASLPPGKQPVSKEISPKEEVIVSNPDRLFKVIVVGNSSVGKTSLLRRFSDGCFYQGTSATVGIDYSVKTVTVENSQVALQIWDTAGQERYRSITKQFFRKADGVVVMYDLTAEQSFVGVRQWLASVQEGAGEDIPIMLLGNKTDLESQRKVRVEVGEKLAKDCNLVFYECSAFSGHNVAEAMLHLAKIMKDQEDREKEKTVQLVDDTRKKKSCCS